MYDLANLTAEQRRQIITDPSTRPSSVSTQIPAFEWFVAALRA